MIEGILQAGEAEYKAATRAGEVLVCCPFCIERGESKDERYRLSLNVENGLANCFNCGWRSRSFRDTARELGRVYSVPVEFHISEFAKERGPVEKHIEEPEPCALPDGYEGFHGDSDAVEKKARVYLRSRGVSTLQIIQHRIGYAAVGEMAWRVLFPVFGDDGAVYGCVGRAFGIGMKPKYLNTGGTKLLWGAQREGNTAVVVEGIIDALAVERAVMLRHGWVAVARLGSTLTELQVKQLKKYHEVVILPDFDKPGIRGVASLAKTCMDNSIACRVVIPEILDGRDPGSMAEGQINTLLSAAVSWQDGTQWRLRVLKELVEL